MIKAILSDFSETILFPKNIKNHHNLNGLHHELMREYGEYNAWDYFVINEELLNFYQSLKPQLPLYVFTTDTVQDQPQIKERLLEIFDDVISAKVYKIDKKTPEAYQFIAQKINQNSEEILFIDDREINLEPATKAGFQTLQYIDNEQLVKDIKKLINSQT